MRGRPAFYRRASVLLRVVASRVLRLVGALAAVLPQSLQQAHSQLQSGQSLQQSSEQHEPSLQTGSLEVAEVPAMPATTRPAATARAPNNLINIANLAFWLKKMCTQRAKPRDVYKETETAASQVEKPDVRRMHQINQEQCKMRCGMRGGRPADVNAAASIWAELSANEVAAVGMAASWS